MMINYENFHNALKNLQEYWEIYESSDFNNAKRKELEQMGIIQAYEVCYEAMRKAIELEPDSEQLILVYAAVLISRKWVYEAKVVLNKLIGKDFKHVHANILMALVYELEERPGMVRKHMGIAKVQRMRQLELLPKKLKVIPNLNEINFKYEIPDWPNTATKDQTMPADNNDQLMFEIMNFMLERNITVVSWELLKYVQSTEQEEYQLYFSWVKNQEGDYSDTIKMLDDLLVNNPDDASALKLKGDTHVADGNLFDSEEAYIKYIQTGEQA